MRRSNGRERGARQSMRVARLPGRSRLPRTRRRARTAAARGGGGGAGGMARGSSSAAPDALVRANADGALVPGAADAVAAAAAAAVAGGGTCARLTVALEGPPAESVGEPTLRALAAVIGAAARGGGPEVDVLPLLRACGHDLPDSGELADSASNAESPAAPSMAKVAEGLALPCEHVAVGGTFDRLHAGHRLLLASAAACVAAGGTAYVGVTGDSLLVSKVRGWKGSACRGRKERAGKTAVGAR